jgi:hypothetical protein
MENYKGKIISFHEILNSAYQIPDFGCTHIIIPIIKFRQYDEITKT